MNGFSRIARAIWSDDVKDGDKIASVRELEALLFASPMPLTVEEIALRLPGKRDVKKLLRMLVADYRERGINLDQMGGRWAFRTADDLGFLFIEQRQNTKELSKAGLETLAIIAYHQPVTRADIEGIRGVTTSKGVLDILLKNNLIAMGARRKTLGRPITYKTTNYFLDFFKIPGLGDLPGLDELKSAGLLSQGVTKSFTVAQPTTKDSSKG